MKNHMFKYTIYLSSIITVILFFIMGFYPYEMEIPTVILFAFTVFSYSIFSLINRKITKIELVYDTIMFLTLNVIGFGLDAFYVTLIPYTFYVVFINFFLILLYSIAFIVNLSCCFGEKKKKFEITLEEK